MSAFGFQRQYSNDRPGFLAGSGVLVIIGIVLIGLALAKQTAPTLKSQG
jgi:hypothetical protein